MLREDETHGGLVLRVERYALLDLKKHQMRPLLDAPIPLHIADRQRIDWGEDGASVVLPYAHLPLRGVSNSEALRRALTVTRVKVNLADGAAWEESSAQDKTGNQVDDPLRFAFVQAPNRAIEIEVIDEESGRKRVITNFSNGLDSVRFGDLVKVAWTDSWGRNYSGALQLPMSYKEGGKYPLVIETNASQGFSLPGPGHAPGQLFAGKGIVVLRLSCAARSDDGNPELRERQRDELTSRTVCVEGAIAELAKRSIIDPARVGLIGFSFTGNHVTHAVTFSQHLFRAAVVVDSVQSTLWDYVSRYGAPRPGMMAWDGLGRNDRSVPSYIDAPFVGDGIKVWERRSPTFNIGSIRTPIMYEYHGPGRIPGAWDVFVLLKRSHRPVEFVHYPTGEHDLVVPSQKASSQERIIDWMLFWLSDVEDSSEEKVEQYQRWRVLRAQRDAVLSAAQ